MWTSCKTCRYLTQWPARFKIDSLNSAHQLYQLFTTMALATVS
jgi:hypothetical protein